MRREDIDLLGRIQKVNDAAGRMVLQVLSGASDDDALAGDFHSLARLYRKLAEDFNARSIELTNPREELHPTTRAEVYGPFPSPPAPMIEPPSVDPPAPGT